MIFGAPSQDWGGDLHCPRISQILRVKGRDLTKRSMLGRWPAQAEDGETEGKQPYCAQIIPFQHFRALLGQLTVWPNFYLGPTVSMQLLFVFFGLNGVGNCFMRRLIIMQNAEAQPDFSSF